MSREPGDDAMEPPPRPFKNADLCTHCGYCLPVCPTYRVDNDETESPRGRVSIVLALASGTLTLEEATTALSRCLLCRACHKACPAGVRPAKLALLARNQQPLPSTAASRLLHRITDSPALTALAARWLSRYQASGLQQRIRRGSLLPRFPALARLEALLPSFRPGETIPERLPPPGPSLREQPRVALLAGCMARLFYPRIAPSLENLLTLGGCEVVVLRGFGCCGAPYREAGDRNRFLRQARRTLDAFIAAGRVDAIVCDSAICAVTAGGYARSLAEDPHYREPARAFSSKLVDLNRLLLSRLAAREISFGVPDTPSAVYHDHCQTRFGLGIMEEPRKLLALLPIEHREVARTESQVSCCGAGGEYRLRHPERSQAIGALKLETLLATGAECIVASNPGCMLHLEAGARQAGLPVRVIHLAELLWTAVLNSPDKKWGKK
ncbi:MAG: (Fe-S)-binding protein [Magnetococcales bacterium]|nr:(Fe-S)-binding protein [Magnetococcales bacterium]